MKTELCEYCSKECAEEDMIYIVCVDAYFCDQNCWDNYDIALAENARDEEKEERRLNE